MKSRMGGNRTEITSLTVQTKAWATPRASMNENRTAKHAPSHGVTHGETLAGQATSSHLAVTTQADGPTTSPRADLNPWFVAALMGLPPDWLTHTTTEVHRQCREALVHPSASRMHSTSAVTDSCRNALTKPSANFSQGRVS